jgi:hypothetical protein
MCKLCDKTFSEPSAAHKHVKATHKKADRSLVMVNNPDWSQLQVIIPDNFLKTVLFDKSLVLCSVHIWRFREN